MVLLLNGGDSSIDGWSDSSINDWSDRFVDYGLMVMLTSRTTDQFACYQICTNCSQKS